MTTLNSYCDQSSRIVYGFSICQLCKLCRFMLLFFLQVVLSDHITLSVNSGPKFDQIGIISRYLYKCDTGTIRIFVANEMPVRYSTSRIKVLVSSSTSCRVTKSGYSWGSYLYKCGTGTIRIFLANEMPIRYSTSRIKVLVLPSTSCHHSTYSRGLPLLQYTLGSWPFKNAQCTFTNTARSGRRELLYLLR